jgi:hypothetical protein
MILLSMKAGLSSKARLTNILLDISQPVANMMIEKLREVQGPDKNTSWKLSFQHWPLRSSKEKPGIYALVHCDGEGRSSSLPLLS